MSLSHRPSPKAIIAEIRYQMRYSDSPRAQRDLQMRLEFWLNYHP